MTRRTGSSAKTRRGRSKLAARRPARRTRGTPRKTAARGGRRPGPRREGAIAETPGGPAGRLFAGLDRDGGWGAWTAVAAAEAGGAVGVVQQSLRLQLKGRRPRMTGIRSAEPKRAAAVLAALGHAQRLVILLKLLEGPATYRGLSRATGLKAGPLYHHIRQLRLAGLLLSRARDLYELTRGGRNAAAACLVLSRLAGDKRPLPV